MADLEALGQSQARSGTAQTRVRQLVSPASRPMTSVRLAALYLREGVTLDRAVVSFGGGDRLVSEYVESEFMARISRAQRMFLIRTAVLERMCPPLCEAVLELPGSGAALAALARANLLLVPLDRRGAWYRYHHLFRDMLLAELERVEPGMVAVLRRRAAAWCLANGRPEEALEYSMAAADVDQAARLVQSLALRTYRQGRVATCQRWLRWLDDRGGIKGHPVVAAHAAIVAAVTGRPGEAERWADAVDHWQDQDPDWPADPAAAAYAALARAALCRRGIEQMRADADETARRFAAANIVMPAAPFFQGIARVLGGDLDDGDAFLADAISIGESAGQADEMRDRLAKARGPNLPGASALTDAELRLLPLLSTYLPVPEIAAELVLSPHTVKSRMKSIYRKLEAVSRSQAVARARELGLVEG